jgi:hypothetical protein
VRRSRRVDIAMSLCLSSTFNLHMEATGLRLSPFLEPFNLNKMAPVNLSRLQQSIYIQKARYLYRVCRAKNRQPKFLIQTFRKIATKCRQPKFLIQTFRKIATEVPPTKDLNTNFSSNPFKTTTKQGIKKTIFCEEGRRNWGVRKGMRRRLLPASSKKSFWRKSFWK